MKLFSRCWRFSSTRFDNERSQLADHTRAVRGKSGRGQRSSHGQDSHGGQGEDCEGSRHQGECSRARLGPIRGCRTSCRNPAAALRLPAPPQDKVAEHQDSDEFTHHVHAPMVEAVNELTTAAIEAEFGSPKPRYEALAKSLAAKVRVRVGRGCRNPSGRAPAVWSGSAGCGGSSAGGGRAGSHQGMPKGSAALVPCAAQDGLFGSAAVMLRAKLLDPGDTGRRFAATHGGAPPLPPPAFQRGG